VSPVSPIDRRLIGTSAVFSPTGEVIDVDTEGLARRLLLFDQYVLTSTRLKEFPVLVRQLGYEGLRDLLSAKLIEIRCECLQLGQVGQSGIFGDPVIPLLSYKFNWLDANDRPKYIHDCLKNIHDVSGLSHKNAVRLKRSIVDAISPLPTDARLLLGPAFINDFQNAELVRASVALAIEKRHGIADLPFRLSLHRESPEIFKAETDIGRLTNLSDFEIHKAVEAGLLGIAGLSQVIGEMKAYNALSGFRDDELPLFKVKLDFLAKTSGTQDKEAKFQRIVDLSGMPSINEQGSILNIDKLLKVRDSNETREFRDWLASGASDDEKEVKERIAGLRAQVGLRAGGKTGKAMRFLTTNLIGLIPHPIASMIALGLGALDAFVVDRVLPRSGITAFVNELYPSIFEEAPRG